MMNVLSHERMNVLGHERTQRPSGLSREVVDAGDRVWGRGVWGGGRWGSPGAKQGERNRARSIAGGASEPPTSDSPRPSPHWGMGGRASPARAIEASHGRARRAPSPAAPRAPASRAILGLEPAFLNSQRA